MRDLPQILARRTAPGRVALDLVLASDCPWLEGHFPGHPILPGVVLVGWAVHFAAALRGGEDAPRRLQRVKFRRPVLPGAALTLSLTARADGVVFKYLLRDAAASAADGVLCYEAGA